MPIVLYWQSQCQELLMLHTKKIHFTKMHGAGNDFVMLDETKGLLGLTANDYKRLGDRHFGVGADQILSVRAPSLQEVDFDYVIYNNDGTEAEHCGNGARCFVRFVRELGLTSKSTIKVLTKTRILTLTEETDQQVTVDMGPPIFENSKIPYIKPAPHIKVPWDYALSMGNPHAVCIVKNLKTTPVMELGIAIQNNPCFPNGVNVGFMQIIDSSHIQLRVYERGAGETLACGSGACAAVVAGIQLGLLSHAVSVQVLGGVLYISWDKDNTHQIPPPSLPPVMMTGAAITVFHGTINL